MKTDNSTLYMRLFGLLFILSGIGVSVFNGAGASQFAAVAMLVIGWELGSK